MSLPANDALTLGLTGNHDSNRSSYPRSLRQTSPKIPFVNKSSSPRSTVNYSPTTSPASTARPRKKVDTPSQSMSNGVADGASDSPAPAERAVANGHANGEANGTAGEMSTAERYIRRSEKAKEKAPIDWEIPRKTLHSSIGFLTLYLYVSHGSARMVVVVLTAALAVIVPLDVLRLNSPQFERIYEKAVGFLMRESEKKTSNGVIWYILGVIFVLSVYPLDLAVISILILSWADTAASTIGRLWGSLTPPLPRHLLGIPLAPRKSLAGFIAGSVTSACVIAGFWGWVAPLGADLPMWTWSNGPLNAIAEGATGVSQLLTGWTGLGLVSLVGGFASGVAEALDVTVVDDNLTLPILSGGCIWGFLKFLSFLSS